jgi:uncharacterized OsmC-like protein
VDRIGRIDVQITAPNASLGARKRALAAAAGKCAIHNTLRHPPEINIEIRGE